MGNLKILLISAISKEYYRFPRHNFAIHKLGTPWWAKTSNSFETIETDKLDSDI